MKTHLQLSIAPDLKEKLERLKEKLHIIMAALIDIVLREHLPEYETRYESPLPLGSSRNVESNY
jgi:hypothetical protein